jgi:hypothetical protein
MLHRTVLVSVLDKLADIERGPVAPRQIVGHHIVGEAPYIIKGGPVLLLQSCELGFDPPSTFFMSNW